MNNTATNAPSRTGSQHCQQCNNHIQAGMIDFHACGSDAEWERRMKQLNPTWQPSRSDMGEHA